jgi:hypothetical protein
MGSVVATCSAGHTQYRKTCAAGCINTGLGIDACNPQCTIASGSQCVPNGYEYCSNNKMSWFTGCPNGCIQSSPIHAQCQNTVNDCATVSGSGFVCTTAYGVDHGALHQCLNGSVIGQQSCGNGLCVSVGGGGDYCPSTSTDCQGLPNGASCISGSKIVWCAGGNKQGEQSCSGGCTASNPGSDACTPVTDDG